jgi:ClpP class serine protease
VFKQEGWGMMASQWLAIAGGALAILVISLIAYRAARRLSKRKHRIAFEKARTRSYEDNAQAYKTAREKLSESWDVVEIIHDWSEFNLGPAGLPEYITFEQAFEIVRQIRAAANHPIAVVIHTMGGYSAPTEMIAKALSQHKGKKVAFVPYIAMSGGTIVALSTEEIFMGSAAALGPIDTQYAHWPASAFAYLKANKNPDRIHDEYLMMIHISEQFEKDAVERAKRLIHANHGANVASELIMGGRPHGETISVAEARDMHVAIAKKECPAEVYALVDAKLQMVAQERAKVFERGFDIRHDAAPERTSRLKFGFRRTRSAR